MQFKMGITDNGQAYPQVAVGAYVEYKNRVLLVKRKNPPAQNEWAIPGGRVLPGESLQAAAEREILEETGISIKAGDPVYVFEVIERDDGAKLKTHYVIIDLQGSYQSGQIRAGDDALEAGWFTAEQIDKLNVNSSTRHLLTLKFKMNPGGPC